MGRMASKMAIRRYTAGRSRALLAACELLVERAPLIGLLALREIRDRYVGSMLGTAWSVLQPLLLMLVLITIFGHVFSMKRAGMTGEGFDFVAYMIAGYVPWLMTGAALQSAAGVIRANSGLVKQISFPVAVLPAKTVLAQAPMLLVGLAVFLLYTAAAGTGISPLVVLLPGLVVIHAMLLLGLAWAIAALGAYFRDLDPILSNLLMLNVFLLPIFMPPGAAPAILAPVISYNPFTPLIAAYQDVLVFGVVRSPISMLLLVGLALAAFTGGYAFFRRVQTGFGDLV
jgi:lipopolysaccharide transport system permease protein